MFARHPLPDEIFVELVDQIFTSYRLVLTIGLALIGVAGYLATRMHDPVMATICGAGIVVVAVRISVNWRYKKVRAGFDDALTSRRWQWRYAAGAWSFSVLIGALAAFSTLNRNSVAELLATTILFAYACGMIVRVSVRPQIAIPQITIAFLPAIIAGLARFDGQHVLLSILLGAFLVAGVEMIGYLNATIIEKMMSRRDLRHMALHDELTGLGNRALLRERLAEACDRAKRYGEVFALLVMDLDEFKAVNDSLGHAAGDAVLKEASERMKSELRPSDVIVRLGGDEFAVIMPQASDTGAVATLCTRLARALSRPMTIEGKRVLIGVSIGASLSTIPDPETMLRAADRALYAAKNDGRGGFQLAPRLAGTAGPPSAHFFGQTDPGKPNQPEVAAKSRGVIAHR